MDTLFTIAPIPAKGLGCIALVAIPPGTPILSESAILQVPVPGHKLTEARLETAFSTLPPSKQHAVLSLYSGNAQASPESRSKLMGIFRSNTFGNATSCWIYPTICRFNHSCLPNASTIHSSNDEETACQIIAEQHIAAGEEICISYNNEIYEISTSRQRAVLLQKQYGFQCCCLACREGPLREASDARRKAIKALREKLYGLQVGGFAILDQTDPDDAMQISRISQEDIWIKEVPEAKAPLTAAERTASTLELAETREAEGFSVLETAQSYWLAAEAMLEQILELKTIVILTWASKVRLWMEKAIAEMAMVRARAEGDEDFVKLKEAWSVMSAKPCLRVGLGFLDGTLEIPVATASDDGPPYAVLVNQGKLQALSERECHEILAERGQAIDFKEPNAMNDTEQQPETSTPEEVAGGSFLRSGFPRSSGAKVLGAALTCAAPIAAYWMMK